MSYYFTNDPNIKSNRRMISFRFLADLENFVSDNGVFSKDTLDFGSRVFLETLLKQPLAGRVLDMGCGIGVIGILLKKHHPELAITMVDINERAVQLAKENSKLHHQNENVVFVSDGYTQVSESYDIIVSNPPIRTGKKVIYRMFEQAFEHLNHQGSLYLVIRDKQGAKSAVKFLETIFPDVQVLEKEKGYWIILANKDLTK